MTPSHAFAVLALAFVALGGAIPTEGLSNPIAISNISLPHIGIDFIFNRANLGIPGGPIFRVAAGGRGKAIMEGPPSLAPESKGPTAMNAASSSSATLLLCEQRACGSCLAFDLLSAPHDVCLAPSVPRDFRFSLRRLCAARMTDDV